MSVKSALLAFASQRFPRLSSRVLASAGYTLDLDRFGPDAFDEWSPATAERQDRAWQPIVEAARAGNAREDVAALQRALAAVPDEGTFLEVGCGGGYNSEIVAISAPGLRYTGLDLSPGMIDLARAHYPDREYVVGSAYELPFEDASFDVVMDGVALLHMPDWPKAIAEYARVSRDHVILHGLTLTDRPTTTFAKYAYGQPSLELVFRRGDVEEAVAAAGLTIAAVEPGLDYDLGDVLGIPSVSETWVLRG